MPNPEGLEELSISVRRAVDIVESILESEGISIKDDLSHAWCKGCQVRIEPGRSALASPDLIRHVGCLTVRTTNCIAQMGVVSRGEYYSWIHSSEYCPGMGTDSLTWELTTGEVTFTRIQLNLTSAEIFRSKMPTVGWRQSGPRTECDFDES